MSGFSEVARNEIWREAIRKETKHIGGDSEFTINPAKLKSITRKPGEVVAVTDADRANLGNIIILKPFHGNPLNFPLTFICSQRP